MFYKDKKVAFYLQLVQFKIKITLVDRDAKVIQKIKLNMIKLLIIVQYKYSVQKLNFHLKQQLKYI